MDYEKKYKEALERAKKLYAEAKANEYASDIEDYEFIFPELRESKDDEIIQFLLNWIKDNEVGTLHYIDISWKEKILAWLEKQKYDRMKPVYDNQDSFESALEKAWKDYNDSGARTVDGCEDDYVECAHAKGFREGFLFGIEKQKEIPMPDSTLLIEMWDKEKAMLKEKDFRGDEWRLAYNAFMNGFARGTCVKFEKQKEQKPADIPLMGGDADLYFDSWKCKRSPNPTKRDCFMEGINYANRLSKPAEWSEEDERFVRDAIAAVEAFYSEGCGQEELVSWLKSLRPRWKPSEEQMSILKAVKEHVGRGSGYWGEGLGSLIKDLEKLI